MSRLTISQRRTVWAYIFLFVPLLFFVFIRIMPTLSAFNISLHEWNPLSIEQKFVGLANFQELWEDLLDSKSPTHHAFVNTLTYVLIGMPLQLVIALIVALLLNEITRFSVIFRAIYFIPFVTSTVAISWVCGPPRCLAASHSTDNSFWTWRLDRRSAADVVAPMTKPSDVEPLT